MFASFPNGLFLVLSNWQCFVCRVCGLNSFAMLVPEK